MTHPDNELRRRLWALAAVWDEQAVGREGSGFPALQAAATIWRVAAKELRQALTYPEATEEDEAALRAAYGKTSEELADEAERGYPPERMRRYDRERGVEQ